MLNDEQRTTIQECIDYLTPAAKAFADLDMGDSKHARCIRTLRALLASAAPAEGRQTSLVRAITDWPGYWINGQKVTAEDYIAWLLKRMDATEAARLPEPKYYGSQEGDGDQHEVKCAYVDGWNACRAAMPATAPTMSEAYRRVVDAALRVIGGGVAKDISGNGTRVFVASVSDINALSVALSEIDRVAAKGESE